MVTKYTIRLYNTLDRKMIENVFFMWSFSKGGTEILYKTALFSEVSYNISKLGNRLQLCRILKIFGKDNDKNIKMKKSPSIESICYMYLLFPKKKSEKTMQKNCFCQCK